MTRLFLVLAMFFTTCGALAAYEGPTAELGRKLFHSPALGTSGKSCAACHPGGKGLENVDKHSDARLKQIVNTCIAKPLAGEPLDTQSTEMNALVLYLRSL